MRALVTGFEPFGGEAINASCEAVRELPSRVGPLDVATAILPTSFARAGGALLDAIAAVGPRIVVCVGQAGDRAELCVEHVALNVQDARMADNDGAQPGGSAVVADGPPAYFPTLPARDCVAAMRAAGLPAAVSYSAGTFVCNHAFYVLMHHVATHARDLPAGFLHVPRLARAGDGTETHCSLPLQDIVRGIVVMLETAAAHWTAAHDERTPPLEYRLGGLNASRIPR